MAEIVSERYDVRVVKVAGSYGAGPIAETFCVFSHSANKIIHIGESAPQQLIVPVETMDEIAAAWMQYRQEQREQEAARQRELDDLEAQARALLAEKLHLSLRLLKVGEGPGATFDLYSHDDLIFHHCDADSVLEVVKEEVGLIEAELAEIKRGQAVAEEAQALAKEIAGLSLELTDGGVWRVGFSPLWRRYEWAYTGDQLLELVKKAQSDAQRSQQEQAAKQEQQA